MKITEIFNREGGEDGEEGEIVSVQKINDAIELDKEAGKSMIRDALRSLKKASAPKQLVIGAGAGWLTGYTAMKIGKMTATFVGGSLLLLQIAHYNGYIRIDWKKMSSSTSELADKVKDKLQIKSQSGLEKFQEFTSENIYVAGGFTGGFFLGIASS